ncbi:MAG: F0F1 ATP synthase subunit epsilon [Candidatus Paceibacterota bacterium]
MFFLTITAVNTKLFEGEVSSVTAPADEGEVTILAHHEPFVSVLKKGIITVRVEGAEPKSFEVEKGILEVGGNKATILV